MVLSLTGNGPADPPIAHSWRRRRILITVCRSGMLLPTITVFKGLRSNDAIS